MENIEGNAKLVKFSRDSEYAQMKKIYKSIVEAGHVKTVEQINSKELMIILNSIIKSNSIDHKILNYCEYLIMVINNYEVLKRTIELAGKTDHKKEESLRNSKNDYQGMLDFGATMVVNRLNEVYKEKLGSEFTYNYGGETKTVPKYPNTREITKEEYAKVIKNVVEAGNRIFEDIEERKENADKKPVEWKTTGVEELTPMVDEPVFVSEEDNIIKRMSEIEQEIQKLQEEYNSLQAQLGRGRR